MLCLSFRKWKLVAPFLELCLCYVFNFFIISSNHHHWATSIKQPNNKANQMILVQLFGFPCRWSHLPRQQINNKHGSAMCFSLTRTCCVIHLPITLIDHPISIPMPSLQFGKLVLHLPIIKSISFIDVVPQCWFLTNKVSPSSSSSWLSHLELCEPNYVNQ